MNETPTPRVDALAFDLEIKGDAYTKEDRNPYGDYVKADDARQLEKELAIREQQALNDYQASAAAQQKYFTMMTEIVTLTASCAAMREALKPFDISEAHLRSFEDTNGFTINRSARQFRAVTKALSDTAAPWSIEAHVRKHFGRYLAEGEQWHRGDWTQEMLEGGWRPALLWEIEVDGKWMQSLPPDRDEWLSATWGKPGVPSDTFPHRTKRPLPTIAPAAPVEIPAGYRELADDEKKGQWVEGAKFWSQSLNGWCIARGDGYPDGTPAFPDERIIVPIAAPVETEPENVCRKCGWNPCICPGPRPLIWRDFATDPPQDGDLCPVRMSLIADVAVVELDDGGYYDSIGAPESRYNWQNLFDTPIKHWIALPHLPAEPEKVKKSGDAYTKHLEDIIAHAALHGAYKRSGYDQMTTEMKATFDEIAGRTVA